MRDKWQLAWSISVHQKRAHESSSADALFSATVSPTKSPSYWQLHYEGLTINRMFTLLNRFKSILQECGTWSLITRCNYRISIFPIQLRWCFQLQSEKSLKKLRHGRVLPKKNVIWSLLSNPPPTCREPLVGKASPYTPSSIYTHSANWYKLSPLHKRAAKKTRQIIIYRSVTFMISRTEDKRDRQTDPLRERIDELNPQKSISRQAEKFINIFLFSHFFSSMEWNLFALIWEKVWFVCFFDCFFFCVRIRTYAVKDYNLWWSVLICWR